MVGIMEEKSSLLNAPSEAENVSKGSVEEVNCMISLDYYIPDDILERIFTFLPTATIIKAASVCKRWYNVIYSRRSLHINILPQNPWYFMFVSIDDTDGCVYDPTLRSWYAFSLPGIDKGSCYYSSSCGLVCILDHDTTNRIILCNPITRVWKRILDPPGGDLSDYSSIAMSANRGTCDYTLTVVKSTRDGSDDFSELWNVSIHKYESVTGAWLTLHSEVLDGWRGGDDSVIYNGVLYCMLHPAGIHGDHRQRLIMYEVTGRSSQPSLMNTSILVPRVLTCGRLMTLGAKVVLVGGIAKPDNIDIITGIGIWELRERSWYEVARMPRKFFQGFGDVDVVFASFGSGDLIFIQYYGSTALLVFDIVRKHWRWSEKCPVSKRFPLQLFCGFCFEPRLDMVP